MNDNFIKYLTRAYPASSDADSYESDNFLQIDDQSDNDNIQTFCNLFIIFKKNYQFELEISGRFPITSRMVDLCEINEGYANKYRKTAKLKLSVSQINVIDNLIEIIEDTKSKGDTVGNSDWEKISQRTIYSLKRFSQTVKDFNSEKPKISKRTSVRQLFFTFLSFKTFNN